MAVQGLTVTLTTDLAAVALAGVGSHGPIRVYVRNRGTGSAYLGGASVTSSGFLLSSGESLSGVELYQGNALYGASTGTAPVLDILRMNDTTST